MSILTPVAALLVAAIPATFAVSSNEATDPLRPAPIAISAQRLPYGSNAEIEACVANMTASLHGQSILGRRGTAMYIQDLGALDEAGVTEHDVMVGRCMQRIFKQSMSRKGYK